MFKTFSEAVHSRYNTMATGELFVVDVLDIFASYLAAFPEGTNPVFRERTEHDCNCCKQFIRRLGLVVSLDEQGNRTTVWGGHDLPYPYDVVSKALDDLVMQAPITGVFRTKEPQYGTSHNFDNHTNQRWDHFVGRVTDKHYSTKPAEAAGLLNTRFGVMKRGLEDFNQEDFQTILDLIEANALYRGAEHVPPIKAFRDLQRDYLNADNRDGFIWANINKPIGMFRNTAIGTLFIDLADGTDLDAAVRKFEAMVAPQNYKRTTALVTPKMIEQAVAKLQELGLEGAVQRRMATIEDVSVNDVLFVDNKVAGKMKDSLTDLLMTSAARPAVDIKKATRITADEFITSVLPDAHQIEVLVENRHQGNFVTVTGGDGPERLFKWPNNFAWSYDGEVTDSIKERVKAAGGKTGANVKLRVSLAWHNADDLDLHGFGPNGQHYYFSQKGGVLDVDMNGLDKQNSVDPVENLSWTRLSDGIYNVKVHNYSKRNRDKIGFSMEIECAGRIESFRHDPDLGSGRWIDAFTITIKDQQIAALKVNDKNLVGGSMSRDKWGIATQTLVPVDTVMRSPNYWGDHGTGQMHLFFILRGCKNPDAVRGIYNEFLRDDLREHRKVFELLASKTKCPSSDNQLSGVGFSSSRGDEVTVVVQGARNRRAYTVTF